MAEQRERKQPLNIEGMFTLKVDNITQNTNEELLREKFATFGDVGDVYIPRRRGSSENRGYAFVRFLSEEDSQRATESLSGQEIDGNVITIQEAKQPRPDNPRQAMRERDRGRRFENRGGGGRGGRRDDFRRDYRRDSRDRISSHRDNRRDHSRDQGSRESRRDYPQTRTDRSRERGGNDRYRESSRERAYSRDHAHHNYDSRNAAHGHEDFDHRAARGDSYHRDYRSRSRSPRGGRY